MTIKDYLGILRQRLLLAGIVVALTTLSAVVLALRQDPEYIAQSKLRVVPLASGSSAGKTLNETFDFQTGVLTEAELIKGDAVAEKVRQRLHLDVPAEELIQWLTIGQVGGTEVLLIEVKAPSEKLAVAVANAFPLEYVELRRAQAVTEATERTKELSTRITAQVHKLAEIEGRLKKTSPESPSYPLLLIDKERLITLLGNLEATRQDLIDQVGLADRGVGEPTVSAKTAKAQSSSDPLRTGILGLIIGLPLALGLALLMDSMTDTIRSKEEAEKIVGVETLGLIPYIGTRKGHEHVVSRDEPYSAAAEAYRTLRINLESVTEADKRRLLFTSPGMAEGKTATTANLGVAFAEAGRSALLVSADLRRPRLHHAFAMDPTPGFSDVLKGEIEALDAIKEVSSNLYVLASGSAEARPDQLLHTVDLPAALDGLTVRRNRAIRPRNDENGSAGVARENGSSTARGAIGIQPQTILVDAPPVLGAAEVSALVSAVDGVVLVLQVGVTRRQAASRAVEQIRRTGGKVIGVVLVGVKAEKDYAPYSSDVEIHDGDSTWSKVVSTLQR